MNAVGFGTYEVLGTDKPPIPLSSRVFSLNQLIYLVLMKIWSMNQFEPQNKWDVYAVLSLIRHITDDATLSHWWSMQLYLWYRYIQVEVFVALHRDIFNSCCLVFIAIAAVMCTDIGWNLGYECIEYLIKWFWWYHWHLCNVNSLEVYIWCHYYWITEYLLFVSLINSNSVYRLHRSYWL